MVIQNLNYAVSCYQVNLPAPDPSQAIKGTQDQEDFKYEMDLPEYYSDGEKNEDFKKNDGSKSIKRRKKTNKKTAVKKESSFKCSVCSNVFDNRDELRTHRKDELME